MSRPARPSFDHITTEKGREASRRLWDAAFGEPANTGGPGFAARKFLVEEALKAFKNNLAAAGNINRAYNVGTTINARVPTRYKR